MPKLIERKHKPIKPLHDLPKQSFGARGRGTAIYKLSVKYGRQLSKEQILSIAGEAGRRHYELYRRLVEAGGNVTRAAETWYKECNKREGVTYNAYYKRFWDRLGETGIIHVRYVLEANALLDLLRRHGWSQQDAARSNELGVEPVSLYKLLKNRGLLSEVKKGRKEARRQQGG